MKKTNPIPSLDHPATYQIKVPGRLDENWSKWFGEMVITTECGDDVPTVTSLTGTVADQAALQGLIERLYTIGLPILSVNCLEPDLDCISRSAEKKET